MAKRFRDTELYDKEKFMLLPPRLKVASDILNLRCNFFGDWQINMTKLNSEIGESVTIDEVLENFKVRIFDNDKLYIEGFVGFQYGDEEERLSPTNRFHQNIAKKLKSFGLPEPLWKSIESDNDPINRGVDTHPDGSGQGQGKGKGKGNSKGKDLGESEGIYRKEAEIYLQARRLHAGNKKAFEEFMQPERMKILNHLGGLKFLAGVKDDDFGVKRLADLIRDNVYVLESIQ